MMLEILSNLKEKIRYLELISFVNLLHYILQYGDEKFNSQITFYEQKEIGYFKNKFEKHLNILYNIS